MLSLRSVVSGFGVERRPEEQANRQKLSLTARAGSSDRCVARRNKVTARSGRSAVGVRGQAADC